MGGFEWQFSRMARSVKSSIIRETLKITQKPGIISFGGGLPAPELFPTEGLIKAAERVLREKGESALQYGTTEGYYRLRELLANRLNRRGINVTPDDILITGGSQQGLDLCAKALVDEGSIIITAKPTYLGAIQAFNVYFPKYITFESDDDGMTVDGLEEVLEKNKGNVRMIYLVPTFQNPDGRTIPLERRKKILELAAKYNVPVIEDDPYSELAFEADIPPAMKALAPSHVVMLGTFSKILAPGLRIAWIAAPKEMHEKLVMLKQGADLHTSTFSQYVIYEFSKDGRLDEHIAKIKEVYKRRRNVMVEAMEHYFPPEVKFTKPEGGLFLWVELPEHIDTMELLPKAVEKNVAYIPGSPFFPDGSGHNTMRLNYSKPTEAEIEEGIKRLAEVFKEALLKK